MDKGHREHPSWFLESPVYSIWANLPCNLSSETEMQLACYDTVAGVECRLSFGGHSGVACPLDTLPRVRFPSMVQHDTVASPAVHCFWWDCRLKEWGRKVGHQGRRGCCTWPR